MYTYSQRSKSIWNTATCSTYFSAGQTTQLIQDLNNYYVTNYIL